MLTLSRSQGLREQTLSKQGLHVPLGRSLGLPRPEHPSSRLLVGVELRLNEPPDVVLVVARESGNSARRLARAVASLASVVEGAVVTRALVLAIQPLGAVGDAARPLTRNRRLVVAGHLLAKVASRADVVIGAHANLVVGKDLVVVRVENQVPHTRSPVVPRRHALKGIMEDDSNVRVPEITPAIHVELADRVHVQVGSQWLVEQLNRRHGRVRGVVVTNLVEHLGCVGDRVALRPANVTIGSAVVETVL
jgi:hypothetical protein